MNITEIARLMQRPSFDLQERGSMYLSPKQLKRLGDDDGYFATPCDFYLQNVHYIHGYCEGFLRRIAAIAQGCTPVANGYLPKKHPVDR